MVVILDYGIGNLGSIQNMLKRINVESMISSEEKVIDFAERLIIPGIGAFDNGMRKLNEFGLIPVLEKKAIKDKIPVLGICLGMQLFTESSEEGVSSGLGWIKGRTVKFKFDGENNKLKIPQMGWNTIEIKKPGALLDDLPGEKKFYFVHSFHVVTEAEPDSHCTTNYGYDFTSMFQYGNLYGVQFHPEKSHKYGMKLLKNFVGI
ncbi:MAG: imidazole glycerol phosphate synthase subunit HisH [Ignavibacteriae bacterium]|nr:imidazole glycerol phosphate synthase subunit HisH [Ignavibacteriota bacterium]